MSGALGDLDDVIGRFLNGEATNVALLGACSRYLERTADWMEVRDVLREDLKMDLQACLDWFSEQDFPDFAEAVEEGWGWNAE